MKNWLDGKPFICDGLMLSGNYDGLRDDTTTIKVFSYPELKYIDEFETSRFNNNTFMEYYPEHKNSEPEEKVEKLCCSSDELPPFRIWRYLHPSINNKHVFLQKLHIHYDSITLFKAEITNNPKTLNEIVAMYENKVDKHMVKECLLYLEEEGWSELIDERWKNDVISTLKKRFPELNDITLEYILKIILV